MIKMTMAITNNKSKTGHSNQYTFLDWRMMEGQLEMSCSNQNYAYHPAMLRDLKNGFSVAIPGPDVEITYTAEEY